MTVCLGGPLDGEFVEGSFDQDSLTHHQMAGGGCDLLEGDSMMVAEGAVEEHTYFPMCGIFPWPSGIVWRYRFWVHESYLPMTAEVVEWIAIEAHTYNCFVESFYEPEIALPRSPLFQYGQLRLSLN